MSEASTSLSARRGLVSTAALVALAVVVLATGLLTSDALEFYGYDFRVQYYLGATLVADGSPLYVAPDELALEPPAYTYPPLVAVAAVPFTALSEDAAVVLAVVLSLAAVLGSLALVGLRDVRCYAAVLASAPLWHILETANVTAFLTLATALAWRYRDDARVAGVAVGVGLAAKLVLWPLVVWQIAMRRQRTAVVSLAVALVASIVAWTAVRFQGFLSFPAFLAKLSDLWSEHSYSFIGIAAALELDPAVGRMLALAVGGALLWLVVRHGRRADDERAFVSAVAAMLAFAPIVWVHYALYLLVPLAVVRPRFSPVWLLPLVLWACPRTFNGDGVQPFLFAAVAALMLTFMLARPRRSMALEEATA